MNYTEQEFLALSDEEQNRITAESMGWKTMKELETLKVAYFHPPDSNEIIFTLPDYLHSDTGLREMIEWLKEKFIHISISSYDGFWYIAEQVDTHSYIGWVSNTDNASKNKSLNLALMVAVNRVGGVIKG